MLTFAGGKNRFTPNAFGAITIGALPDPYAQGKYEERIPHLRVRFGFCFGGENLSGCGCLNDR